MLGPHRPYDQSRHRHPGVRTAAILVPDLVVHQDEATSLEETGIAKERTTEAQNHIGGPMG